MEAAILMNWELFVWIMGVIGVVMILLLSIIAYFLKADRESNKERFTKHELLILEIQKQVNVNQEQTKLALQALQINQEQDIKRLELFEHGLADQIIRKLRAITPE